MARDEIAAAKEFVAKKKHKHKVLSKSAAAKKAAAGEDLGKPGKGFDAMVAKLTPKYGEARAKKIAGAKFQAMRRAGQL